MGRPRRPNTEDRMEARLKEGRGLGHGTAYRPWLTTYDVPSIGTSERVRGNTVPRIYHLLSQLEAYCFLYLDWMTAVVDIREQVPLLPLDDTKTLATALGIRHPNFRGQAIVMTTDFVVTVLHHGETRHYALSVKYSQELHAQGQRGDRTRQKLRLEREFWERQGIRRYVITEHKFNRTVIRNLRWLHPYYPVTALAPYTPSDVNQIRMQLEREQDRVLFTDIAAERTDRALGLEPGSSMQVARHLWASRQWPADLRFPLMAD